MEHKLHRIRLITVSLTAAIMTIGMIILLEAMRTGTNTLV